MAAATYLHANLDFAWLLALPSPDQERDHFRVSLPRLCCVAAPVRAVFDSGTTMLLPALDYCNRGHPFNATKYSIEICQYLYTTTGRTSTILRADVFAHMDKLQPYEPATQGCDLKLLLEEVCGVISSGKIQRIPT